MLLGIDLGTTWCKAAAVSEEGRELAHERVPVPWRRVATGAEIEAEQLVRIAVDVGRRVLARVPDARVAGVGVTGMAEAGVLLDSSANPTAPVIAWHDSRGREETAALERELGAECFSATTGLPPSPQWTLLKYRWMRAHFPETRCGMRWLNVPEWIVRRLGGEERGELSLASRTGLLDLDRRESWAEAREWAGAPPDLLAPPEPAGTPAGRVGAALDEARGAVLCVGGHDHLCAAVGAGAAGEGDVFDSCGTAEVFVRTVDPPLPAGTRLRATAQNVTNGWHAVPNRQALLGALDGGLALQRAGRLLGAEDEPARRRLDDAALDASARGDGEALLDGRASAAPPGILAAEQWRAALEALAARGAAVLESFERLTGASRRLVVSGGGARSEVARVTKRAAFGLFEQPGVEEAGARGAALLAGCAAGVYGGVGELPAPAPTGMEACS